MKKIAILTATLFVFLMPPQKASAQYYFYDNNYYSTPMMFEFGGSIGAMNCLTDVGGRKGLGKRFVKDLNLGNNQLNGSVYFAAIYKEAVGLRIEGSFGHIKAYDSILKPVQETTPRYNRNLSFTSKISEFSIIGEMYPMFLFINWASRDDEPPSFSPYLLAGIGYFSFNPQTVLNGRTVDLQPLSTEGQGFAEYPTRKPYKLQQISFPVGIGMKYELSRIFNLRAEFMYRFLTTDYLDDLSTRYINPSLFANYFSGSQLADAIALNDRRSKTDAKYPINPNGGQIRGNPKNNDAFFSFNLKIGILLGWEKR